MPHDQKAPDSTKKEKPRYIKVETLRPEGYEGTCLRPLGLCDLGGCCEICWYRPDHPRFKTSSK
jgi:hypothetical protein